MPLPRRVCSTLRRFGPSVIAIPPLSPRCVLVGKTISHYEVQEKLGQGGMGEVYRASDTKLRRAVALKVLPSNFATDAERMARFQKEAHVLASLNHPHIAQIFGLEEDGGVHALVLELVEGPTLADRILAGRIPLDEAVRIAVQIAQALESAHDQGIIHRDLKPENVKLTEGGAVKVLDFGLAKAIEGTVDSDLGMTQSPTMSPAITGAMTAANVILGTAGYMSPEQARGQPVDKRADVWAFGVVLYEMLVGRRLFTGDTVSDTLAAVLRLDPEWGALPDDTPPPVRRLLRRCLERDATKRLRDVGDARIVLEEVQSGEGVDDEVIAAAVASSAPDGIGRGPLIAALAGTAVVAAVAGFFAATQLTPAPPEIPLLKVGIPVEDLVTSLSRGGTTAAISPDGRHVAFTSANELWVRDLRELQAEPLVGTDGAAMPFWSPDGEWIGYGTTSRLMKVRLSGGAPVTLCELENQFNPAAGGAWSAEGRIVFTDGNGPLLSVSAQGGDPDTLLPLDETDDDFHNVTPLPGGRGVIFVVHEKDGTFDRIDLFSTGVRKTVVKMDGNNLSAPTWSPSGHLVFQREGSNRGIWALPFSLDTLEPTGEPFLAVPDAALPSISATGTMVLAQGVFADRNRLAWMDRDGNLIRYLGVAQDQDAFFALSPDGRRAALRIRNEDPDLWIVDLERETQTRLTFGDANESWPFWSHDGQRIYYQDSSTFPATTLRVVAADGTSEPDSIGPGGWCAVSPDDRILMISLATEGSDFDLYWTDLDDKGRPVGEPHLFVDTKDAAWSPRFSPDGRFVAYGSSETGRNEVYLKPFPTGSGKWQVSVDGGYFPQWNEDGTELFYTRGEDLLAVSVETNPQVRLGTPQVLFSRPAVGSLPLGWPDAFAATPDGARFLVALPPEQEDGDPVDRGLVVVQNWYAEFDGTE